MSPPSATFNGQQRCSFLYPLSRCSLSPRVERLACATHPLLQEPRGFLAGETANSHRPPRRASETTFLEQTPGIVASNIGIEALYRPTPAVKTSDQPQASCFVRTYGPLHAEKKRDTMQTQDWMQLTI